MLEHTLREARRLGDGRRHGHRNGLAVWWTVGGRRDFAAIDRSIERGRSEPASGSTDPVQLRQAPLVRALGNQIHVVNEGAPGDPSIAGRPADAALGARAIQITDLVDPVSANRNLQALALEQVKYPRDLPLLTLMAYGDGGEVVDLTAGSERDGKLDWTAPAGTWTLYALFPGGTASWSNVPRRAAKATSSITSPAAAIRALSRALRSGVRRPPRRAVFARSSTTRTKSMTRPARRTGRRASSRSSRSGAATICAAICPRCSAGRTDDRNARVLADYRETVSDLLLDKFTTEWATGRTPQAASSATRRTARRRTCSISTPRATSPRPRARTPRVQVRDVRRPRRRPAASCPPRPRPGSASISAPRSPTSAPPSTVLLGGVNHIVYHGTAYSPPGDPGRAGSSTRPWSSARRTPGGTTSAR